MTAHVPRPAILPDPAQRLLVVQASAGTGKTFFLEHRVVDLLLRTDATIDRLLVVTFTEKATAELRARIRDKLTALAHAPDDAGPPADTPCWTIDAAARRKLRDALAGFDRAPIHTIHGFCQRLLVEDAFAGRRLFDQQQVPDDVAFTEAYHQALREELARQPAERRLLEAYLDAGGGSIATLGDVLLACVRRGAPVTPRLEVDDLLAQTARFAAALHAVVARGTATAIAGVLGTTNGNTKRALTAKLTRLGTALAEAVASEADPEPRAVAVLAALARLRADHAGLDEAPDKLKDPTPAGVELIDAAAALVRGFVPLEAACAARFLDPVLRRVRAGKSRRGQFDFQDMLRLVRDTLLGERGAELAERLRRRHPWAMIDEFQDTDEVQWDIFRRVWADGDRTSLTIVGDPKQAIYAFRGADVQTYLTARADLEGRGADTVPLVDNYRSSGDVVEAVNALLRSHGEFFTGTIQYDHPVRAAGGVTATWPDGTAPSPVHVFEIAPAVDGEKLAAPDLLETLAERAAEEIRRLLDDPAYRLRVTDRHGQQQTLAPQDIHVLTRTGKESDRVAVALRARGVPCALYQREHLFEAPEAAEVADLLDAVADPRDRTARLLAWNTSFFGVPLADLRDLAEVPDGHPLIALLHDWRGLALRKDYDQLFARVLDDTRWIERAVVAGGGERAITNVLHLFELLHDDVARAPCEIHELAARLRGWIRTGTTTRPDDIDLQRLETDRHAVQIMTIHRAKGLEAAVVFVVGGYGGTFPDKVHLYHQPDGRRFLHVGPAVGDVDALIDADLREENQRLMYVALTRARVRLYLASAPGDYKHSPILPLHRCVGLALAARATDADARRLFTSEVVRVGSVLPPPPVEVADDLRGWRPPAPPAPPPEPDWAALRDARGGVPVTSYSRLRPAGGRASDRDDVRAEQRDASREVAPDDLPPGAATGLFLHDALEHLPFATAREQADPGAWANRADVGPVLARAARRHGVDERHLPRAATVLHAALTRTLRLPDEVLPALADATRLAREVEFVYPLGGGFARGYIDALVAWDDRLWVVDYKSDILGGLGAADAERHVAEHYADQQQLYGLAAARMLGLRDADDARRRLGGLLYLFLRGGEVVHRAVSWDELAAWTASLGARVDAGGWA